MKKLIFAAAIAASVAPPAAAQVRNYRDPYGESHWYVATEYGYASASGVSFNGVNFGAGWRPSRHFGLEIGDYLSRYAGTSINSVYLDAIGLLPLTSRISAFGSIGGAIASNSAKVNGFGTISISKSGWRAGAGLEARITRRIDLRFGYHRQNALADADEYTIGLAFRF
jgi:opacity protein-like surface antigen